MRGDTSDISHIAEFGSYDWVWFITPAKERKEIPMEEDPGEDLDMLPRHSLNPIQKGLSVSPGAWRT